jgi:hypothetical protein
MMVMMNEDVRSNLDLEMRIGTVNGVKKGVCPIIGHNLEMERGIGTGVAGNTGIGTEARIETGKREMGKKGIVIEIGGNMTVMVKGRGRERRRRKESGRVEAGVDQKGIEVIRMKRIERRAGRGSLEKRKEKRKEKRRGSQGNGTEKAGTLHFYIHQSYFYLVLFLMSLYSWLI